MMSNLLRSSWVVLFLVIVVSVPTKCTEKVGRCPREKLDKKLCRGQVDQCSNNADCNGESLCCSTGCNKVCLLPSFTACDHANFFYKNQVKLLNAEEALDISVPKCTESGAFEEIQCNSKGICWCVDNFGFEKGGTRAKSRMEINCTRSNDRCSGPQCRMLCPYGFELDKNGCEMCLCKDICKGVKCPGSLECQLQEVSCATEPCPPVPTCKKPRTLDSLCPIGTPFTIPENGNPFLCGSTPGKPTCPPGFNCNVHSGDDYGVCCGSESFFEKPGLCPAVTTTTSKCEDTIDDRGCQSSCAHDLECPEMKKCCMTENRGKQCGDPLNSTLCLQQKKIAEILSTKEIEGRGYVPQCDSNGNFLTTQCSRNGKICWCVDSAGRNVPHSLAPANLVNCTNISAQLPTRRRDLVELRGAIQEPCDVNICANTCEFGYKTDEVTGCGICDCNIDPCSTLKCPMGTKCSYAVPAQCQQHSTGCQLQPTCLPNVLHVNPCDNGPPLFDHSTNELVVCSESGATCPSSHVCVKASVNTDGLCCLNVPRLESTKAGMCPFISSSLCNGTESEKRQCNSDKDCEGDMKCCATACGAICADPLLDAQTESNKLPTMCQYLENVELKQNDVLKNFKLALSKPKCKSSGEFDEIQCAEDACFCADEFGMEISSTRVLKGENNLTSEFCLEKRGLPSCLDMTCRLGCDYGYKTKDNCRICECVNPCEQNRFCDEDNYCELVDMDCSEGYCPAVPYCIPRIYAAIAISQQFSWEPNCPNGSPYFDAEMNATLTCRPRARMLQCPDDYFCHELNQDQDFGQCCPIFEIADESSLTHGRKGESDTPAISSGNILEDFPIQSKTSLTDCELSRERQMELVLQNHRVNYIPRCDPVTGSWSQVQCIDEVNMCWCVNPSGNKIPGSITSGRPTSCTFRQSRGKFLGAQTKFEQGVCSEGQTVHVCSKSLCDGRICMAYPEATCGIDPCGGCRVKFFDQNNNVVDCNAGLGQCQKDAQSIINSRTWINQQKQSVIQANGDEVADVDAEFPASLDRIIDGVLQERLGRAIASGGSTGFPTVAELVAQVMKQSQTSFESFGDKLSQFFIQKASPSPKISSSKTIQKSSEVKQFGIGGFGSTSAEFMESFLSDSEAAQNAFSSAAIPVVMEKAACPQPSPNEILFRLTGTCLDLCNYDDECGHDERCCLVDCGYRCKRVAVEIQVKVVQQQAGDRGSKESSSSLESILGDADSEESNMILNPPSCRSNGEYERRQSQGDLMWCVDAQGRRQQESFTKGHLVCSEEGKMVQRGETQPICPNEDSTPMICSDECLKSSCKGHPEAICVADPCDSCKITYFTTAGEKVQCEDKCAQAVEPGLCRASFSRYFYNSTSRKCEEFFWGGCGGNDNNFETVEECHKSCRQEVDRCSLPLEAENGVCKENVERWYFDAETESCQPFLGCAVIGPANNFPTLKHCQSYCPSRVLCPNIVEGGLDVCNRAEACRNLTRDCPNLESDDVICNVEPCSCTAEVTFLGGGTAVCEPVATTEQQTSDSSESAQLTELPQGDSPAGRSIEVDDEPVTTFSSQNEPLLERNVSTQVVVTKEVPAQVDTKSVSVQVVDTKSESAQLGDDTKSESAKLGDDTKSESASLGDDTKVAELTQLTSSTETLLVVRPGLETIRPRCLVMKERYFSKCDDQGNFVPTQCSVDEPVCWCVDSIGNQLEGTSTFLAGSRTCPNVSIQKVNVRLSFPLSSSDEVSGSQVGVEMQDLLRSLQAELAEDKVSVEGIDGMMNVDFALQGESSGQISYLLEEGLRRNLFGIFIQNHLNLADLSSSRFHYVVNKGQDSVGGGSGEEGTSTIGPEEDFSEVNDLEGPEVKAYDTGSQRNDDGVTAKEVKQTNEEMNVVGIVLTVIAAFTAVLIIIGLFLGLQNKKTSPKHSKEKFRPIGFSSPFGMDKKEFESVKI